MTRESNVVWGTSLHIRAAGLSMFTYIITRSPIEHVVPLA